MTSTGSYDKESSSFGLPAELQRLKLQASQGWPKEFRTLSWLGLKDGQSVLELGSGPGSITSQLLTTLPSSAITCLENDPAMIETAKALLQNEDTDRISFIEGSIDNTGLPDNTFDFAYARFIFQHLKNPQSAASEIHRVLKPGGKFVIHDIDDGLFGIFDPPIAELPLIVEKFGQAQAKRGGNRQIGRHLWKILESSEFCHLDLEIIASHSGKNGIDPFIQQLDPDRFEALVDQGLVSADALAKFRHSRQVFKESPDACAMWLSFLIGCQKPL